MYSTLSAVRAFGMFVVVSCAILQTQPVRAQTASVEPLGVPPTTVAGLGGAVSADGGALSGHSEAVDPVYGDRLTQAFRWTEAGGMQLLGFLPGGNASGVASMSADGATVVGTSNVEPYGPRLAPFRWTAAGGMQSLGFLAGGSQADVVAVSADGSSVVGFGNTPQGYPSFRWTAAEGMQALHAAQGMESRPTGVSADGKTVVGWISVDAFGSTLAYRWTETGGWSTLPYLPGDTSSRAEAVSADGTVVAGRSGDAFGLPEAFVWTSAGGAVSIGFLPGGSFARPTGVSGDGSTVVGIGKDAQGRYEAFRWTPATGLVGLGRVVGGGEVYDVYVSRDGGTVAGTVAVFSPSGLRIRGFWWTEDGGMRLLELPAGHHVATVGGVSADGTVIVGSAAPDGGDAQVVRWVTEGGSVKLVVTSDGDSPDTNVNDGVCDTDPVAGGDQCTLRAAIEQANAVDPSEPAPKILVSLSTQSSSRIAPTSALPKITRSMVLDGTGGAGGFTEVDGASAGVLVDGLRIEAEEVTVRGWVINGFSGNGIRVTGGGGHMIQGNRIGYSSDGTALDVNRSGAIRVEGGARNVTIGAGPGEPPDAANLLGGGLIVADDETQGVRIFRNTHWAPEDHLSGVDLRPLVDLGDDGPTCAPWLAPEEPGPNGTIAPPRILRLPTGSAGGPIEGIARPGATVVAYRVTLAGSGNGRYWPRKAEPIGMATAGATGAFRVTPSAPPAAGDFIAVTATDSEGNTSELSQLRRPVIFLPGIGGTWLKSQDGTRNWLPLTVSSDEKNERMSRLAMSEDGTTSLQPLLADEVLEEALGLRMVYGPIHDHLEAAGFHGHPFNLDPAELDQWRFPNDWRLSVDVLAADLLALIDRLTGQSGEEGGPARSCQVDLIAHSNGGMISSIYLRRNAQHARDFVNRFVTSGTPYLGSTQAVAAHSNGYIFGVDESPIGAGWDVAWGDMLAMVRNVAGAYGLMPSRTYYDVIAPDALSHAHGYATVDLYNEPIVGYDATFEFMTRPKVNEDQIPYGLDRNAAVWQQQQERVHDFMNDWSAYDGPPQIFRHAGLLLGATETGWFIGPGREYLSPAETRRSEAGDTDRHRAYRERLRPIMGAGDMTVPLVSATLGRNALVGKTDLSGVDESPWIEEFEYYSCAHGALTEPGCMPFGQEGPEALDRLVEILISGYQVLDGSQASKATAAVRSTEEPLREVIYVMGSEPVTVLVTDGYGRKTGPMDPDIPGALEFDIPGVAYQASALGAVVSAPADSAYTIEVVSRAQAAGLTLIRQRVDLDALTQLLYPDQSLPAGGRLLFTLQAGGTADGAPWSRDADGDGSAEASIAPIAQLAGTAAVPAIPFVQPAAIAARVPANALPGAATLRIPDTGTEGWTWSIVGGAPWLGLSATSGTVPAEVGVALGQSELPESEVSTTLTLTLANGSYSKSVEIPVQLTVGVAVAAEDDRGGLSAGFALAAPYPNPGSGPVRLGFTLPSAADIRLEVFDLLGRSVGVVRVGPHPAGSHAATIDTSILPAGVYVVRLSTGRSAVTTRLLRAG